MSHSVNLSLDPEAPNIVDADSISSVFVMNRARSEPETHIYMKGRINVTIGAENGMPEEIMESLHQQGVTLLRQPGSLESTDNARYVTPLMVNFIQVSQKNARGKQVINVGTRGGGNISTYGATSDMVEDFLAAVKVHKKIAGRDFLEFGARGEHAGYTLSHGLHIDPPTIAYMEERPGQLVVNCIETKPFAIEPTPVSGGTRETGIHASAVALARLHGDLIVLPSMPVVYFDARRVLPDSFAAAADADPKSLLLRLRYTSKSYKVSFATEDLCAQGEEIVDRARRLPTSMLPPAYG